MARHLRWAWPPVLLVTMALPLWAEPPAVASREKTTEAWEKPVPTGVEDLRAIELRLREVLEVVELATVHVQVGVANVRLEETLYQIGDVGMVGRLISVQNQSLIARANCRTHAVDVGYIDQAITGHVAAGVRQIELLDVPKLDAGIALDDAIVDARGAALVGEEVVELASRK